MNISLSIYPNLYLNAIPGGRDDWKQDSIIQFN